MNVNWNIIRLLVFMNLSPKSVSIIVVVSSDKSWWPSAQDFLQYGRDHLVCDIAAKYLKKKGQTLEILLQENPTLP